VGQSKIAVLDLAGNYDKMSKLALEKIAPDLEGMGLALTLFYIENISLPPEVEEALDKRTKMGVLGDMQRYTQYQTAEAIPAAAQNPGGTASLGMGMAAGMTMGQQMANQMAGAASAQPQAAPPPLPTTVQFFIALNGRQEGPFDANMLSARMREGVLTRTT